MFFDLVGRQGDIVLVDFRADQRAQMVGECHAQRAERARRRRYDQGLDAMVRGIAVQIPGEACKKMQLLLPMEVRGLSRRAAAIGGAEESPRLIGSKFMRRRRVMRESLPCLEFRINTVADILKKHCLAPVADENPEIVEEA